MQRSDGLVRAGLILTATGIVSASTVRYAIDESGGLAVAWGLFLYLALILIGTPRRPSRFAPVIAFFAFAAMYLSPVFGDPRTGDVGLALYVVAGAFAYVATPQLFRPLTVAAVALWTPALRFFGPNPAFGNYPMGTAVATAVALVFLVAVVMDRRRIDIDERIWRVGLGLLAVACVARITERHDVVASVGSLAPDDLWAFVVVLTLPLLVVLRLRRPVRDALAMFVALVTYVLVGIALLVGKGYHVDAVAIVHRAAEIVVGGGNPYHDLDTLDALRRFGLDPGLATNLEDGSILQMLNYPALSFLVPAPFVALGLTDIRFVYLAEIVILVLVLVRQTGVPWRPLVAAAVIGNALISRQNVLAGVDPLWAILTIFAFAFFTRRSLSPVLVGLACAARQPAWLFVPFYLLMAWKQEGRRGALRRAGLAAAAGVLPNLPFVVLSPGEFIGGVFAPMVAPLEPYGVGLIRFAMEGALPLLPRGVYGLLTILALVGLLWILWRLWRLMPIGTHVFPSVILWFAWRSLQNYFSFAGVFAMAGDDAVIAGDTPAAANSSSSAMSGGIAPDRD